MKRKLKPGVGIGGPSIIMIFVILCLTTLAALALMTANADWKLMQKTAAAAEQFYAADNEAEEILAEADAALRAGQALQKTTFALPVSDTQKLLLIIEAQGDRAHAASRKLVPAKQWDYDLYKIEFDDRIVE